MPTHQSISGTTDEELLQRMVATHPDRFGESYWTLFAAQVAPRLPERPAVIDLGCGPGLFLRDLSARHPGATLYGYDLTPAMIEHAKRLPYAGPPPTLSVHDVARQPLPNPNGSVHLVAMSSVLHVLDEPLPTLGEILRVLAPGGVFLLHDWIRQPLRTYLVQRRENLREGEAEDVGRGFRLFPVHNKFTVDDWQWLLAEAGFSIAHQAQLRPSHRIFITSPSRA